MLPRPVAGIVAFGPAQRTDVIEQRVKPDIADILPVKRQFDAPGQTRFGTRDAEIFQISGIEDAQQFVAVALRTDEIGMLFDVFPQPGKIL